VAGSRLESEDSRARKSSGPIVSVIDDDAGTRDALADLFDTVGYQTYKFNDAEDFLRSGAAHVSGVLITDIQLDGID
jgi:FixJ family two-component response regulator